MSIHTSFKFYAVDTISTSLLKPSEETNPIDVLRLASEIRAADKWNTAIPIERATGIIMDGNHRFMAAKLLGLKYLPCILLHYDDPRVSVKCWKTGGTFPVDIISKEIIEGGLFPYKTTRHAFSPELPQIDIKLSVLAAQSDQGSAFLAKRAASARTS